MPYYKKRKLARFIKAVVDNEAETKRLVQTSQVNWASDFQATPIKRANEYATDGNLNMYCWQFRQNTPMFWPVDLHPLAKGMGGGYQPDDYSGIITTTAHTNEVRIGSEARIKGISLDFMTWLKPEIPFMKLQVKLIRYARDDLPNADNMFKNYTQNRMLDMIDNRRFKTLKTWTFKHYQSHPTTAGTEMAEEGITGNDMNTDAYSGDKVKICKDANGKTWPEWEAYVTENYPDYRIMSYDDLPGSSTTRYSVSAMLFDRGMSGALETGIVRYSPDPSLSFTPTQYYGSFRDSGNTSSLNSDVLLNLGYVYSYPQSTHVLEGMTTTPTRSPQQVLLVPTGFTAAKAAEGQILVPIDKKHKLWIPGYLLGEGGNVKFKEKSSSIGYDRDGMYGHVLMFQTLSNYKTWEYDTGFTLTENPTYLARMTDFLQVTYFKDF